MKKSKKITIFIFISILLVIFIFFIFNSKTQSIEMTINDEKVEEEEYLYAVNKNISEISNYFVKKYNAKIDKDFWSKNFQGEVPIEKLEQATEKSIRHLRAIYHLAIENKDIESSSFSDMQKRREQTNKSRENAIKDGKVVYGLSNFSLDTYIAYESDQLEKSYISNNKISVSEDEIKKYYDENKDKYFTKNDAMKFSYIKINPKSELEDDKKVEECKSQLKEIEKKLFSGQKLSEIIKSYPNLKEYYEYLDIKSEEVGSYSRYIGDVLDIAVKLNANENSPLFEKNGTYIIVDMVSKEKFDYQPLDEVRDNIIKNLRENKYNNLLEKKAESLVVKKNEKKLIQFIENKILK